MLTTADYQAILQSLGLEIYKIEYSLHRLHSAAYNSAAVTIAAKRTDTRAHYTFVLYDYDDPRRENIERVTRAIYLHKVLTDNGITGEKYGALKRTFLAQCRGGRFVFSVERDVMKTLASKGYITQLAYIGSATTFAFLTDDGLTLFNKIQRELRPCV